MFGLELAVATDLGPPVVTWTLLGVMVASGTTTGGIVAAFFLLTGSWRSTDTKRWDDFKEVMNARVEKLCDGFETRLRAVEHFETGFRFLNDQVKEMKDDMQRKMEDLRQERRRDTDEIKNQLSRMMTAAIFQANQRTIAGGYFGEPVTTPMDEPGGKHGS
jgi:chromosome segregation ATPase